MKFNEFIYKNIGICSETSPFSPKLSLPEYTENSDSNFSS